eukprot:m.347373 g.347373  ORF g.347373 m.347373 type:complete len:166 (+) comp55854_c0_seq3:80-577(+)
MTQQYLPPPNFGIVEEDLYRSGLPNELNFPFLEKLRLKTIVVVSSDEPSTRLMDFIADHDITFAHLGQNTPRASVSSSVSEEVVVNALGLVLSQATHPILLACPHGRHHTGTVIGCLRKLQNWSLTSIFEEYRRFAGRRRLLNEQFIEFFDTDMVAMPATLPPWL